MTRRITVGRFDPGPSGRFAARVLRATRAPAALIGRLAVWAWLDDTGEHEYTKDMDLAVRRMDMPHIRAWLAREGVATREVPVGGVAVYHPDSNINVEFIDRTSPLYGDLGRLYAEAVDAAHRRGAIVVIGKHEFRVAPPEYLIAMKLATGETRDERDVVRLIEHTQVDLEQVRRIVMEHLGAAGIGRLLELSHRAGRPLLIVPHP